MTPTMSTCSQKKPAKSPPAAPPSVCATGTAKESASASHGAPTPPSATAPAKNATAAAKPAPPAAQKKVGAANAHLYLPSQNPSHRLCRLLCRKHQNAPFSQKLRLLFTKNRRKTSPSLSCRDRSHLYPVTEQKTLAKYQHLLTSFAAIRYPFDTLPVCPQPLAMEAAASRPGQSWARPAPPSPRAAAPPTRSWSSSSTTVSRADMLHCAAWPQVRFSGPGSQGCSPDLGRPQWPVSDSSVASQRLSETHPHFELHPDKRGYPRLLSHCDAPFQPTSNDLLRRNQAIAGYPVSPQIPQILIQTTTIQESGMHPVVSLSSVYPASPSTIIWDAPRRPIGCGLLLRAIRVAGLRLAAQFSRDSQKLTPILDRTRARFCSRLLMD